MFRFITPVFLLQAFCVYHAYKNKAETWWYFIIMGFPLVGCAIYLYKHFYSRQNIEQVSEGVKQAINTNYHVQKMEKRFHFNGSVTNMVNLADAYVDVGRFEEAADLYGQSLDGFMHDDPELNMKMMLAEHVLERYQEVVDRGNQLLGKREFEDHGARIAYAWSLFHTGNKEQAEEQFDAMNGRYTNYLARVEYAQLLRITDREELARQQIRELLNEFSHLSRRERHPHRNEYQAVKALAVELGIR